MDSDGKDKASTSESRRQKLFVGGLSRDTSDDSLKQYFLNYGDLSDCVVIRDSATKESRGFGYVTFNDYRITKTVLQDKRDKGDHKIDNKAVEVKRAIPRDDDSNSSKIKTTKVFIGGIPDVANEEDITKAVCDALEGEIVKVDLIKKKEDGEVVGHRGFCFVQLENEDDADELCCIKRVEVKGKWVEMKKAEPKGSDGGGGRGRGGRGGGYAGRGRGGGGTYGSSGGFGGGSQFGGSGYGGGGGGGGGSGYDQYGGYGGYGGGGYSSYGGGGGGNNYYENYGGDVSSMYGQSAYYPPSGGGGGSARGGARGGSRYRPY